AEKLAKLDTLLSPSTDDPEHLAVLANLFALPTDNRYGLKDLTPQKRKEETFEALLAQLDGLAARQPVLLIFEDVHWMDPTSLELLASIVEHTPQLRCYSSLPDRSFWHLGQVTRTLQLSPSHDSRDATAQH